ncbi:MAG: hypothetical protein ACO2PM_03130 [Pyrobaculum sp.]|jgi:hypothetical protein
MRRWLIEIWKAVKEGRHAATDVKEHEQTLEKKEPETRRRDLL